MLFQLGNESTEHPAKFICAAKEPVGRAGRRSADSFSEDQVGFKLLERALGDAQEVEIGWLC